MNATFFLHTAGKEGCIWFALKRALYMCMESTPSDLHLLYFLRHQKPQVEVKAADFSKLKCSSARENCFVKLWNKYSEVSSEVDCKAVF